MALESPPRKIWANLPKQRFNLPPPLIVQSPCCTSWTLSKNFKSVISKMLMDILVMTTMLSEC